MQLRHFVYGKYYSSGYEDYGILALDPHIDFIKEVIANELQGLLPPRYDDYVRLLIPLPRRIDWVYVLVFPSNPGDTHGRPIKRYQCVQLTESELDELLWSPWLLDKHLYKGIGREYILDAGKKPLQALFDLPDSDAAIVPPPILFDGANRINVYAPPKGDVDRLAGKLNANPQYLNDAKEHDVVNKALVGAFLRAQYENQSPYRVGIALSLPAPPKDGLPANSLIKLATIDTGSISYIEGNNDWELFKPNCKISNLTEYKKTKRSRSRSHGLTSALQKKVDELELLKSGQESKIEQFKKDLSAKEQHLQEITSINVDINKQLESLQNKYNNKQQDEGLLDEPIKVIKEQNRSLLEEVSDLTNELSEWQSLLQEDPRSIASKLHDLEQNNQSLRKLLKDQNHEGISEKEEAISLNEKETDRKPVPLKTRSVQIAKRRLARGGIGILLAVLASFWGGFYVKGMSTLVVQPPVEGLSEIAIKMGLISENDVKHLSGAEDSPRNDSLEQDEPIAISLNQILEEVDNWGEKVEYYDMLVEAGDEQQLVGFEVILAHIREYSSRQANALNQDGLITSLRNQLKDAKVNLTSTRDSLRNSLIEWGIDKDKKIALEKTLRSNQSKSPLEMSASEFITRLGLVIVRENSRYGFAHMKSDCAMSGEVVGNIVMYPGAFSGVDLKVGDQIEEFINFMKESKEKDSEFYCNLDIN